jgi:hypothetical protein
MYLVSNILSLFSPQGKENVLSNFFPCSLKAFGEQFPSAEHAFQCSKALQCGDLVAEKIRAAESALEAKQIRFLLLPLGLPPKRKPWKTSSDARQNKWNNSVTLSPQQKVLLHLWKLPMMTSGAPASILRRQCIQNPVRGPVKTP